MRSMSRVSASAKAAIPQPLLTIIRTNTLQPVNPAGEHGATGHDGQYRCRRHELQAARVIAPRRIVEAEVAEHGCEQQQHAAADDAGLRQAISRPQFAPALVEPRAE